jgi:hypothetical protein
VIRYTNNVITIPKTVPIIVSFTECSFVLTLDQARRGIRPKRRKVYPLYTISINNTAEVRVARCILAFIHLLTKIMTIKPRTIAKRST